MPDTKEDRKKQKNSFLISVGFETYLRMTLYASQAVSAYWLEK
jgi:hypothetical protein